MTLGPGGQGNRPPRRPRPTPPLPEEKTAPASTVRGVAWHDSPQRLAAALRATGPGRVRRVHVFQLPPGILGGLYAASFYDGADRVHRCLTTYANPAPLEWALRPLREALSALRVPAVEGRVEVGRNTGEVLHYFLPGGEDSDRPGQVQARRDAAREAWLLAAAEAPPLLRRVEADGDGLVLCASAAHEHFLIRLEEGGGGTTLADVLRRLGVALAGDLAADHPLTRDILGEWREE